MVRKLLSFLKFKMSAVAIAVAVNDVDLQYVDMSYPSLCIPRVFNETSENMIYRVFKDLNFGEINRIDIITRRNEKGEPYKRVFIHFRRWYWGDYAETARKKLISGKEIKVVYSNPWYWKVSANRNEVRRLDVEEERRKEHMEEIARKKEQERRKKNEEQIEEERLREKELQIAEERRREKERRIQEKKKMQMYDDPELPEMELFKIDYGNIQIPKNLKKKLVVRAV